MSKLLASLGLTWALLSAPATAETPSSVPAPATAPSPARQELALELARISQPRDLLVEAVVHGYDQAAAGAPDEEMVALNKQFPGFMDKLRIRGREELAGLMARQAAVLHQKVADIYAAELSEEHLRHLISFMGSQTGQKFIRTMALAPTSSESADDLTLTKEEVASETRSAAAHSMNQMSGDENIELIKFAVSPAGQAHRRIAPQIEQIVAANMTELMGEFTARMEPITLEVLESYEKGKAK